MLDMNPSRVLALPLRGSARARRRPRFLGSAQGRPVALDTMTVVASRTRTAAGSRSVEVITRDDIARSSARNVADVLSTVSGIDVYGRSAAQADVSIRGSSPEQIVVLLDGVRIDRRTVGALHARPGRPTRRDRADRNLAGNGLRAVWAGRNRRRDQHRHSAHRSGRRTRRSGSFGSVTAAVADGASRGVASLATAADFDKSDGDRDGTDYRIGEGRASLSAPTSGGTVRTNLAIGVATWARADFCAPTTRSSARRRPRSTPGGTRESVVELAVSVDTPAPGPLRARARRSIDQRNRHQKLEDDR